MNELETDVLVLGAGLGGLVTALAARGRRVCVLSLDAAGVCDTASDRAQGGIAAAVAADDSPALHLEDTLLAGCGESSRLAADMACREAPSAIRFLDDLGVPFAREAGHWSVHREAAHSRARVLHVGGDGSGAAIMAVMRRRVAAAANVELLPATRAIALLSSGGSVHGVLATGADGRALAIRARAVVIATGGLGSLYSRSTNPVGACGDGLAMALAAGARAAALEFVQFHPTALAVAARPLPLLSEALRGAGARLVDERGASLMQGVHPLGDLAPRDVVARAIYAFEQAGGRARLDATRLTEGEVREAFPAAHRVCLEHGFDLAREPVPVTPAAHYHMGGIAVDLDGRSSLPGLWAVGEVACTGLHGANRLASNSLLEAVVFGRRLGAALEREPAAPASGLALASAGARVGTDMAMDAGVDMSMDASADAGPESAAAVAGALIHEPGEAALRELMWRSLGVVRNAQGLADGLADLARGRERLPVEARVTRARWMLAEQMMRAALQRRDSIGAHFRSDSPPARVAARPRRSGSRSRRASLSA